MDGKMYQRSFKFSSDYKDMNGNLLWKKLHHLNEKYKNKNDEKWYEKYFSELNTEILLQPQVLN